MFNSHMNAPEKFAAEMNGIPFERPSIVSCRLLNNTMQNIENETVQNGNFKFFLMETETNYTISTEKNQLRYIEIMQSNGTTMVKTSTNELTRIG